MSNKNKAVLSTFIDGMKGDYIPNAESNKSFYNGVNGRLYSYNGTIAFSSIKGTKIVMENKAIIKYLGYAAFNDELIILVKCKEDLIHSNIVESIVDINNLISNSFDVSIPYGQNQISLDFQNQISLVTQQVITYENTVNSLNFETPFSCINNQSNEINFEDYFKEIISSNPISCQLKKTNNTSNNIGNVDCFYSLTKNIDGTLNYELLWSGKLNWPIDAKIITFGIEENNNYKRVYFTDYFNEFRVLNIKDKNLAIRKPYEFSSFQSVPLLQPIIESINENGKLKSGIVFYTFRGISDNGQITTFSPLSDEAVIVPNDTFYSGGSISEITNKSVKVKCSVLNYELFANIECVAIEYETNGSPTSIRSLGIKQSNSVVYFTHTGNEPEFSSDLTLSNLLEKSNSWKYCSDLASKKNKLLAAALRNDPLNNIFYKFERDFKLKSWDKNGNSFNCLINPKPSQYRYIDADNNQNLYTITKRVYSSIKVIGNFEIRLNNEINGVFIHKNFENNSTNYIDFLVQISNWITQLSNTNQFLLDFPNLKIEFINNQLLFSLIDTSIDTDLNNYNFVFNTPQVIQDTSEEVNIKDVIVGSNLVYGAISLGYNNGNGIKITYESSLEELMTKATDDYPASSPLLDIKSPNLEKGFFKGEIYRLGILPFDTNGSELFTIPLGDIMIPKIGDLKKYLDDNGNVIISSEKYVNSKVIGDKLYAEKITLRVEVKLSCEMKQHISMYQLVYVERTEDNRTILAQGMSAPLMRVNTFGNTHSIRLKEEVDNKWNLPYYGGPTYDRDGLDKFDDFGENYVNESDASTRVITNRRMFYFDSPDLIFNKVSNKNLKTGVVDVVARLNPDNINKQAIRSYYKINFPYLEINKNIYPQFSRSIYYDNLIGEDDRKSNYVNVSVFLESYFVGIKIPISYTENLKRGQIMSSYKFGVSHDVSNNAMTLEKQSWFYSQYGRSNLHCPAGVNNKSELFNTNNFSPGYETEIIRTEHDLFTQAFINQNEIHTPTIIEDRFRGYGRIHDTLAMINIYLNNEDYVYGGRTELAYSQNIFIPLSKTIPVLPYNENNQLFKVNGDTYTSLFIRNKNTYNDKDLMDSFKMNNHKNCLGSRPTVRDRNGAWAYAVVLESSVEPQLSYNDQFYKENDLFDFGKIIQEDINDAYFQQKNLKGHVAKPINFKDDPLMDNIIAVSDTKMNGDYIDAWTSFKANNFYELDKDKGAVLNLAKYLDKIYAIQANQTSSLTLAEDRLMQTSEGNITVNSGDGTSISNHIAISDFGTRIRRAIIERTSNDNRLGGFSFFDESKIEFINTINPMLVYHDLHLSVSKIFHDDKIIDSEGYYDYLHKETNIRLRTEKGNKYMLSYNHKFNLFNGWYEIFSDIYMEWNNQVFAPKKNNNAYLHQLNEGNIMNFFDDLKTLKIGVTINDNNSFSKIFKHWVGIININYKVKRIVLKTSSNQIRVIDSSHYRYRIKEGQHTVPLKNSDDWADLRGEYMTMEIEIESFRNQNINIVNFVNFVRNSYL